MAAGHRLVSRKGADFKIVELCSEANVALQTFYRYFGSKDQLLVALIGDQIREHTDRLRDAIAGEEDPVERLRLCLRSTFGPLQSEQERASARFTATQHWRLHPLLPEQLLDATQPFTDLVAAQIEAGTERGSLHPRNVGLDAWLITRTVMSAIHQCVFLPSDLTATIADDVIEFCITAVGGQPRPRSEDAPPFRWL